MNLDSFLDELAKPGSDIDPRSVADAVWLAARMTPRKVATRRPDHEQKLTAVPLESPSLPALRRTERPNLSDASPSPNRDLGDIGLYPGRRFGGDIVIQAPGVSPLANAMGVSRALRPFRLRIASKLRMVVDEEETAERYARERRWLPALVPARTSMFDLALILDDGPSMRVWRETLIAFRRLVEHQGLARDIRVWQLDTSKPDRVNLLSQTGRVVRSANELIDPVGRRLVLVVTDCVSPGWWGRHAVDLITAWARLQPVSLVQLLPQHLWPQTALRFLPLVQAQSARAGVSGSQLRRVAPRRGRERFAPRSPYIPVTTLETDFVEVWSRLVAGRLGGQGPALAFGSPAEFVVPSTELHDRTPERIVQDFRARSSPMAFRLACILAASVLRLPVMRLVQRTMLERSDQVHLAEFFNSGLLMTDSPEAADPETVVYSFKPGVRDALLSQGEVPEQFEVLRTVSRFIVDRFGGSFDFDAYVVNPASVDFEIFGAQALPFATVAADVLQRFGGRYQAVVGQLRGLTGRRDSVQPPLQAESISVVFIIDSIFGDRRGEVTSTTGAEKFLVSGSSPTLQLPPGNYLFQFPEIGFVQPVGVSGSGFGNPAIPIRWKPAAREVIVYGSSKALLPQEHWMCDALGRSLAQAGIRLCVHGWPGVDSEVSQSFAVTLTRDQSRRSSSLLVQYVPPGRKPNFNSGRRAAYDQDKPTPALRWSTAVILIGGRGTTIRLFHEALRLERMPLPIAQTGGDAAKAFAKLPGYGANFPELAKSIQDPSDATEIADELVRHIMQMPRRPARIWTVVWIESDREGTDLAALRNVIAQAGVEIVIARNTDYGHKLVQTEIDRMDAVVLVIDGRKDDQFTPQAIIQFTRDARRFAPYTPFFFFFANAKTTENEREGLNSGGVIAHDAVGLYSLLGIESPLLAAHPARRLKRKKASPRGDPPLIVEVTPQRKNRAASARKKKAKKKIARKKAGKIRKKK